VHSFLVDWYRLWTGNDGQRRTLDEAEAHYKAWRNGATYQAVPHLQRAQQRMTAYKFEGLSQFLRDPVWEATSNGAECAGRAFRHRQAPHFNLRKTESIEHTISVTACLRKAAAAQPALGPFHTCQRGRKRRGPASPTPYALVAWPSTGRSQPQQRVTDRYRRMAYRGQDSGTLWRSMPIQLASTCARRGWPIKTSTTQSQNGWPHAGRKIDTKPPQGNHRSPTTRNRRTEQPGSADSDTHLLTPAPPNTRHPAPATMKRGNERESKSLHFRASFHLTWKWQ